MTGDEVDKETMCMGHLSDLQMAGTVRMLYRDTLNHEAVVIAARDRIMYLSQQLERFKHLAKERGEFIINGEELGYITAPSSENDKAYHIFMRCKCIDESAAKQVLKTEHVER